MKKTGIFIVAIFFNSNVFADGWAWYAASFNKDRLNYLMDERTPTESKKEIIDLFESYLNKEQITDTKWMISNLSYVFQTGQFTHPYPEKTQERWHALETFIESRIDSKLNSDPYSSEIVSPTEFYYVYTMLKNKNGSELLKLFKYGRNFESTIPNTKCPTTGDSSEATPWVSVCTEAYLILAPEEVGELVNLLNEAIKEKEYFSKYEIDIYALEQLYKYSLKAFNNKQALFFKGNN